MTLDYSDYLTVSALSQYIKAKFDRDPYLQDVFVVGEISNFRARPNAHQYFNLKDDTYQIPAVMFKGSYAKLPFTPEEGMKVYARGRVQTYPQRGTYQIILTHMEPDGVGAFYLAFEQLKKELQARGWFDQPKRPLPPFPHKIAVVTSPTGAVIRDILTTVRRRYPIAQIVVFPTRVQGEGASEEIAAAFAQIQERASEYDLVIVARGGGSIEDLWCFNTEIVAEAILNCPLPVISSIGHETDTTIADLVADMRAPTPTAAAELAVPVLADLLAYLTQQQAQLNLLITQRLQQTRQGLDRLAGSYVLTQPDRLYQSFIQRLDHLTDQLNQQGQGRLQQARHQYTLLAQRLANVPLPHQLTQAQTNVTRTTHALNQATLHLLEQYRQRRAQAEQLLTAHNPLSILGRGYTLTHKDDQIVTSADQLAPQDELTIQFADGTANATVTAVHPTES